MLAINRWGVVRAASTVSVVLQEEGIQDPENYVVVTSRKKSGADTSFYLKKGKLSNEDLNALIKSLEILGIQIDYVLCQGGKKNKMFTIVCWPLTAAMNSLRQSDLDLSPPTDDRPFFDHFQRFGSFQKSTSILPNELNRALQFVNIGDLALLTLLGEAAVLSFLFILVPVIRFGKRPAAISRWSVLAYFLALGFGFILIEISLIQKHILFLGQPVYSITSVLCSILLSAGIGSYLFQRIFREGSESRWLTMLPIALGLLLTFELVTNAHCVSNVFGSRKSVAILHFGITGCSDGTHTWNSVSAGYPNPWK